MDKELNKVGVYAPDQGEILSVANGNYRIIVSVEHTGRKFSVIEMIVPPGGGPAHHSHPAIQETFYVVEGELGFRTESERKVLGVGGFLNVPLNGGVHCFKNVSEQFAKVLCTVTPAGLENVFREIGTPAKLGEVIPAPELTPQRIELLKKIDRKYNLETFPPNYLD